MTSHKIRNYGRDWRGSEFNYRPKFEPLKKNDETIIGIPPLPSDPLIRSSYHAEKQVVKLRGKAS